MKPAWWLPSAHLQTIWSRLTRSRRLVRFSREVLATPDDDDLVLDHTPGPSGAPRVLLLHGLEGSAHSFYAQGIAALVARAGWRGTVINFRSCARDPTRLEARLSNRRPRLYHSGETADFHFAVNQLADREPAAPLYAIGVSLGGNVLLKWLGETGAASPIRAAATISVPYDLAAASRFLERRVGLFYVRHFLATLRAKGLDVVSRFPHETGHIDPDRLRRARTFRDIDDCLTAPLHGFASADDYYAQSSSLGFLSRIQVPTLCISAGDDPLIPAESVERARRAASPQVTFELTRRGGHAGFVTGPWPWRPRYWAEERAFAWLEAHEDEGRSPPPSSRG
jgi:predicted alpha/beta-fold hydrolase